MRLRSTGLGKTELEAKIVDTKRVSDTVIFFVDVIKPVRWHTRMAFQEKDLRALVYAILKPASLRFIIKGLLLGKKEVRKTEDF